MRILVGLIAMMLAPTVAKAEEKPVDDEKMVCRSERSVGSNRSIRVCKTRAEWEAERANSKRTMDRFRSRVPETIVHPVGG
jgi:hypothetical protein